MADGNWSIAQAKAKLSEVVEQAKAEPQHLTKNGKEAAVVLSPGEYRRLVAESKTHTPTVAEVLLNPKYRGLLTDEEMKVFDRDPDVGRPPIEF